MKLINSSDAESIWSDVQDTINDIILKYTPYTFMLPENDGPFWLQEYDDDNNETGRIAYLEESNE